MEDLKTRIDKRSAQLDASAAAAAADWAESDAGDAIDFAAWAVDNARLAVLHALAAAVPQGTRCEAQDGASDGRSPGSAEPVWVRSAAPFLRGSSRRHRDAW